MRRAGRREKARVYSDPVVGRIVNHSTVLFAMDPAFGLPPCGVGNLPCLELDS